MAQTFTKVKLSASTDGKQIKVASTGPSGTGGTTIHTADPTALDEIWIYCVNSSSSAVKLTIQWGETTSVDGEVEITIPAESGYVLVIPGLVLTNSLIVKAFAATANVLLINGFVNRIS